jgi:threonine dehydrogenase-like Zn-dependent dehydrogenase
MAKQFGADEVLDPLQMNLDQYFDSSFPMVDFVFECSGDPRALDTAMRIVRRRGTIVVVGISAKPLTIDPLTLISKEITIRGTTDYNEEFGIAIDMLAKGSIVVQPLISAILPMEKFDQAFSMLRDKEGAKVLLEI